jgi:type I restriction enzyme M protein
MTKHIYFQALTQFIGFIPTNEAKTIYSKSYQDLKYTITINFEKEQIDYPKPMNLGDKTTSNFQASENFVVLECVDRLLIKGYKPENITLEKKWGLGHRDKGKADIFVSYPKNDKETSEKAFLIIECKTSGKEFEHEFEKTRSNGGQLLSYYVQEQETMLLCLYTSLFKDGKLRYANRIIEAQEEFKGKNKADIYKLWNDGNEKIIGQSLKYNGVFDEDSTPYNVILKPLKRKDLSELQQGDSGYIYNQFAEILRHNVVSDKPNAFNKMFNLILAKIVDEEKPDDEELSFQWKDGDTDIDLQKRLNDLYKKGMRDYLNKEITDFSDEEVEEELRNLSKTIQDSLRKRITALRLHKNNEFAFKEVFDEISFQDNAKVVREVVILMQNFQLRYSHKQQFLSNFFELLLSNTLKQEAGQFFTPVPVAKFIISSLPLQELIEQKIKDRKADFLPTVIDYAAGSGHFLTEAMDEIQHIIQQIDTKNCPQNIKNKLESWKTDEQAYQWADDYIYGIEKDYRLSKIAKVSCFLNGDGIANIIHADGLDTFDSKTYINAPLLRLNKNTKDNPNFDVLVANPPYSVSAFIKTLARKEESFDLHDVFTEQSKEIECLFMERTKQIVKENGLVGIILPSSILNNAGVYTLAREIIFKYFKIISIVEFGSSTFMATGTNTITLFLRRRKDADFKNIQDTIQQFFKDGNDNICNGEAV